ncbi:hypothetical protein GWE18_35940 [Bradyrhizobium sp. CSA112]|uniref:hypothetical protein n=1 Tax=Bradyrhizobium sp. CSA112 TaxID=2699170 RepID=UPI0023AF697E|nr:hypothetical protein [Bradyrhizobium sp. CSA112]MDE5458110.1 hypothetical protein [Bradyrhizobium sp. CSA112]
MFRHLSSVGGIAPDLWMIQKSLQSGFAPEDSKEGSTSMKRTVMFLLLGPSLVALAVLMVAVAIAGPVDDAFVALCVTASFLITLPVSAITGLVDGYLARGLPPLLRAFLAAAIGMMGAIGLVLALFKMMFSPTVPPEVMNGALCAGFFLLLPMGLCSLLSNDDGNRPADCAPDCVGRPA